MRMMKELDVTAPLRKEMDEIVEKRCKEAWGSEEWVSLNNRWYELLAIKSTARIQNMESDLKRSIFA